MPVDVAAFRPDHLDAAARLYMAVFNSAPWHDQWTVDTARRRLADTLTTPNALGLVASDHELIGFVIGYGEQWFDGMHFYVSEMCVAPDRQRTGIGTRLLRQLEQTLHALPVTRIYLLTMGGGPAEAFYVKNGFYASPKMVLMTRRL